MNKQLLPYCSLPCSSSLRLLPPTTAWSIRRSSFYLSSCLLSSASNRWRFLSSIWSSFSLSSERLTVSAAAAAGWEVGSLNAAARVLAEFSLAAASFCMLCVCYACLVRIWSRKRDTDLYSDPARWWGIGYDVEDKVANILIAVI